jgi:hypothetical protein
VQPEKAIAKRQAKNSLSTIGALQANDDDQLKLPLALGSVCILEFEHGVLTAAPKPKTAAGYAGGRITVYSP